MLSWKVPVAIRRWILLDIVDKFYTYLSAKGQAVAVLFQVRLLALVFGDNGVVYHYSSNRRGLVLGNLVPWKHQVPETLNGSTS